MIEIALTVLKFAALTVGGVFAAIGLLTNYRHEDGAVSKWGKVALFGIVLSAIIGAATQGIEMYRNRQTALRNKAANRKSEDQNRHVLAQITRAMFPIRTVAIQRLVISYPANDSLISTPLKRLKLPSKNGDSDSPDPDPWVHLFRGYFKVSNEGNSLGAYRTIRSDSFLEEGCG